MNERLKELLDQCTSPELTKPWPLIDAEKFAELIVNECINVGSIAWLNDHNKVPVFPAAQIKRHFGVK